MAQPTARAERVLFSASHDTKFIFFVNKVAFRPSVNNVSARLAMKNVAKCDMHRDLQRVEN